MQSAQVPLRKLPRNVIMFLGMHSWVDGHSRPKRIPLDTRIIMPVDTAGRRVCPEVACIAVNNHARHILNYKSRSRSG